MALRKSHLYSSLWQSCDQLRGGMDASQYKDYILTLLFMKYVSDKYAGTDVSYADIEVPPGGSFADMVALKGTKEIGDGINVAIRKLADANDYLLKGVIDQADFNDESKLGKDKEMQDRLSKLVGIFEGLDFRANRAHGDDLLGDAYEYLMRHFATQSGKSKGQFYTPAEVSRIMAQVIGIGADTELAHTVYDPTCGSGSLLIKAADEAPEGLSIYGQEKDVATWTMARMNMILHGRVAAEIKRDNTLAAPQFREGPGRLKRFDFAVANPPFSDKAWTNGLDPANDEFRRFEYGEPPAKNGDLAFLLHLVASLNSTGKGAIIMPHGVLFRGNREAGIRRNLVRRGLIKGVIGLPANLFFGTGRGSRPDTRAWCPYPRSPARPMTTTSTSRDTSTRVSRRTCMTWVRTCTAASRTTTSTLSASTGRCFRVCGSGSSRRMAGKDTATRGWRPTKCGRPSSNTRSSRRMGTGSAGCWTVGGGSMHLGCVSLAWVIPPKG